MKATMMSLPLSTQMILRHGQRLHGASSVAYFDDGRVHSFVGKMAERGGRHDFKKRGGA